MFTGRLQQLGGDLEGEEAVGFRGEVAHASDVARFVLHLDEEDGVLVVVDLFEVVHQCGEGCLIGVQSVLRDGREHVDRLSIGANDPWKARGIGFDPGRSVVHVAVLPCAKPQKNDVEIVRASTVDYSVDVGEIELTWLTLELLPVNRGFDSVGMQSGHGLPHLRQFAGPGARVVNLPAEDEERLAINEEGVAAILLHEAWWFGCGSLGAGGGKENEEKGKTVEAQRREQGTKLHAGHLTSAM